MERNRIVLVRDHSGSMTSIKNAATKDFNAIVASVRAGSIKHSQDTLVSIVECGYGETRRARIIDENLAVTAIKQITPDKYSTNGGGTPLWDSVGLAIELLERTSPNDVSNLVFVTTDGVENASDKWSINKLVKKIKELQNTDRWTFVFRVPSGSARGLINHGIPNGNIIEWEQTDHGATVAQEVTTTAFDNYFTARSSGITSTQTFYANLNNVSSKEVEKKLVDISSDVQLFPVSKRDDGAAIREFVEKRTKKPLRKGTAFYQLTKPEKAVQSYKVIVIRDKTTNAIYGGSNARQLLKLPNAGNVKLIPDQLGNFEVFIQSTSVNRKLVGGSHVLFWDKVS